MSIRVLIVEDSAAMSTLLAAELAEQDDLAVVAIIQTESQAKQWLDTHPDGWDVAIVDLFLQEGTGVEILRHCRNRQASQKVVVATNHAVPSQVEQCTLLGADQVFSKLRVGALVDYCCGLTDPKTGSSSSEVTPTSPFENFRIA